MGETTRFGANRGATAGAIAGVVGCAVFLVLHAAWIVPIWFVAPVAFGIASAAGAAVGALLERAGLTDRAAVARALVAAAAVWLVLAPAFVTAELGLSSRAAPGIAVVAGFFVSTIGGAAVLGWRTTRSRRGAGSGALAGLLLAVGPGHNIPLLAGTPAVRLEIAILAAVVAAAAAAFAVMPQSARSGVLATR